MKSRDKIYIADFETTSYKTYLEEGYTRVWLYAVCDLNENIVDIGSTIEGFIKFCSSHSGSIIYFHNLKFDGSFILDYLMHNEYEYKDKVNSRSGKGFNMLVDSKGSWYSIAISMRKGHIVRIWDSLKVIPIPVKTIAQSYCMDIQKEVIDYGVYEVNDKTIEYIEHDVRIVARALKEMIDLGLNKMTIGSNAYNSFKNSRNNFDTLFPVLDKELLLEVREAYRGGYCMVNPRYANEVLENVYRYDYNSEYPAILANEYLPYGYPIPIKYMGEFRFEVYKLAISFRLKKGCLPTLLKGNGFSRLIADTYYTETEGIEVIWITNIDFELLERNYDIDYLVMEKGYGFKTSKDIFNKWVTEFYKFKQENTGGKRMVFKLLLNNLYGKFGSKCEGSKKIPKLIDDKIELVNTDIEPMKRYYIFIAMAVTSYGHKYVIDMRDKYGIDNFVYCDTDSLHMLCTIDNEYIDNKALGKLKLEGIESKAKYVRQKTYVTKEYDKEGNAIYNITCAGMTQGLKDFCIKEYGDRIFEVFKEGFSLGEDTEGLSYNDMKLLPKRVKGGVVLVPTKFEIKSIVRKG